MSLPIGIQLYAVRTPLAADPAATLGKLHEIGYREVETAGFAGRSAAEFRKLLTRCGEGQVGPELQLQLFTDGLSSASTRLELTKAPPATLAAAIETATRLDMARARPAR